MTAFCGCADRAGRGVRDSLERWLFGAFLALLAWAPLPLGSNRPWGWGLLEVWLLALLASWLLWRWREGLPLAWPVSGSKAPLLWFLLAVLYPLLQVIPLPEGLLGVLSPETVRLRHLSGLADGGGPLSLDAHATLVAWLKGIAYLTGFWLTLVLVRTRRRALWLVWVLLASGAFQALFGLLTADPAAARPLSGTFVNTNHLAGFLELTLPVAVGLMIGWVAGGERRLSWRESLRGWLQFISGRRGVLTGLAVTMLLALFMTRSRTGNASLLLSMLLVVGLSGFRRQRSRRERRLLVPLLLVSLLAGSWIGLGHLMGRYVNTDLKQEGRWAAAAATLEMVADHPLFGSGAGTFATLFPRYKTERSAGAFLDHAHNDHLEFFADRGVLGYALLAAGVFSCWAVLLRGYLRRRDPFARGLLFASLAATASLTLHGLMDFNFQIPANALYFMVLLALGLRGAVLPAPGGEAAGGEGERESGTSHSGRLS